MFYVLKSMQTGMLHTDTQKNEIFGSIGTSETNIEIAMPLSGPAYPTIRMHILIKIRSLSGYLSQSGYVIMGYISHGHKFYLPFDGQLKDILG